MAKKYSKKFWFIFWTLSIIFLISWHFFWQFQSRGIGALAPALDFVPFLGEEGEKYQQAAKIADYFLQKDDQERNYLILFENNLELRPGGGFLGAFALVKIKNGQIVSLQVLDSGNFDCQIPEGIDPPYPMISKLGIDSWNFSNSNYSPDFAVDAQKAIEFYHLGGGQENFDGVIGITADVLKSVLKITGPIQLEDYPGIYDSENAVITLEYQVEQAFENQGIERSDRKSVIGELAKELRGEVANLSLSGKMKLAKILLEDLEEKNIQLYFSQDEMQEVVVESAWGGQVDQNWQNDFLMMVDANLGSFKSDYYIDRQGEYFVDFSGETPKARLLIRYRHNAKQKDWMTRDYYSYLRVYVPEGAWLEKWYNLENIRFGQELGKKFFAGDVNVPIGEEKVVLLEYSLPENISAENYVLKIQKQLGISQLPILIHIIDQDGSQSDEEVWVKGDRVVE